MTALDDRPATDDERRAIADRVYSLTAQVHASAARRAMADAVLTRDLEHRDQLELFRINVELIWLRWPGRHTDNGGYQPHPAGGRAALQLLEQFGAAWEATDARHDAVMAAATKRLDSLEVQ